MGNISQKTSVASFRLRCPDWPGTGIRNQPGTTVRIRRNKLCLVRGDKEIFPGIEFLLTPGHTVGHQVVAVRTAKGIAVIGSDAAHVFSSYRTDIPSALITDMIAWMKSYDKIRAKASSLDLIFPGHDPAMLKDFPRVAEDVSRLV
jgi:glyoxylase-like metal-dependent hydrolase (beta-lactamase superfamily II)